MINFSPTISLNANPTQTQTVPELRKELEPPSPEKPTLVHNLKCLSARIIGVKPEYQGGGYTPSIKCFVEDNHSDVAIVAAVATFRNDAMPMGTKPTEINNIRAHVVFRNMDAKEIGEGTPAACWLNEYWNTVDFPIGEPRTLILSVFKDKSIATLWNKRSWVQRGGYTEEPNELVHINIDADHVIAEVQLLSYRGETRFTAKFEIHNGDDLGIEKVLE
jgi:hypothetical protein